MTEIDDAQVRQTAFGLEGPLYERASLPPDPTAIASPRKTGLYLAMIAGAFILIGGILLMAMLPNQTAELPLDPSNPIISPEPVKPVTLQDRVDELDFVLRTYEQEFDTLVFPPIEPEIRLDPKQQ